MFAGRSLAQLPGQVDAMGCSRLTVLSWGSFISSGVSINQAGPLPAGSNSGWAGGKHFGNGKEPVESTAVPQTHRGTYPKAFGACATPDSGPESLREGAFGCTFHPGVRCGCRVSPGQRPAQVPMTWCSRSAGRAGSPGGCPTPQSHSTSRCCLTLFPISGKVTTSPSPFFLPV